MLVVARCWLFCLVHQRPPTRSTLLRGKLLGAAVTHFLRLSSLLCPLAEGHSLTVFVLFPHVFFPQACSKTTATGVTLTFIPFRFFQLAAVGTTLAFSIGGGIIVGKLCKNIFAQSEEPFVDDEFWEVPEEEEAMLPQKDTASSTTMV